MKTFVVVVVFIQLSIANTYSRYSIELNWLHIFIFFSLSVATCEWSFVSKIKHNQLLIQLYVVLFVFFFVRLYIENLECCAGEVY